MIHTWFNTPERIDALEAEASSWLGTPFFANGNTKRKGVSCQKLVSEIYKAVGCHAVDVPNVAMAHARFSRKESLVENFMSSLNSFTRVDSPVTGDLIGFRIGRVVHHLGIVIGRGEFIHAMDHVGTTISQLGDPTWGTRLAAVWRPIP